ncbi:MAG: TldD/PmbA family protein [Thermoplasmata archaeon]|nr:TldD/PmbA family protein [Euryarchaeota archaeon]RLF64548.1 MAG: TldD/PmbA family protein [Thermoplasmata archaeon]
MVEVPDLEKFLGYAEKLGAEHVTIRFNNTKYELISVVNGVVSEYTYTNNSGIGISVLVNKSPGFASTNSLDDASIKKAVEDAVNAAKAVKGKSYEIELAETKAIKDKVSGPYKVCPFDVDEKEKIEILMDANKVAKEVEGVKSASTRLGLELDQRVIVSNDGIHVEVTTRLVGLSHISVAGEAGSMERVWDSRSQSAGFEFIRSQDWNEMAIEISNMALDLSKAKVPKAGRYTVVLHPDVVGLLIHEAFGHASEGDLVYAGASVLANKIGEEIGVKEVSVVDEGIVEGGYFFPYDDEGVPKKKTYIVKDGKLMGYLTSRAIAKALNMELTGNARAQDFRNQVLVRQTNYYIEPRDMSPEELIEDIDYGIYITGKGAGGGEVNSAIGTFTFGVGYSRIIRNGELAEPVRGVTLTGMILEVLKNIDGIGKDLEIRTSVFGGCGKSGQRVRVGDGGPHIRVRNMIVGGR